MTLNPISIESTAITDVSAMDKEFDIGYQVGAVDVSIRNSDDLHELWSERAQEGCTKQASWYFRVHK